MIDRYAHIGFAAKQSALEALSSKGYVTNNDTKSDPKQSPSTQVVDFIGGRVGI
jgi:hypothetical protein